MKTLMLIAMFLCLGAFFIISNENLHLGNGAEFQQFSNHYIRWLGNLFENSKSISGYVVKFEWLPNVNSSSAK